MSLPTSFNQASSLRAVERCMHDKLTEVRQLMADGFVLVDIESENGCVEARLRRGTLIVTIEFQRPEARALLFGASSTLL